MPLELSLPLLRANHEIPAVTPKPVLQPLAIDRAEKYAGEREVRRFNVMRLDLHLIKIAKQPDRVATRIDLDKGDRSRRIATIFNIRQQTPPPLAEEAPTEQPVLDDRADPKEARIPVIKPNQRSSGRPQDP